MINNKVKIDIPQKVNNILEILNQNGFEAFIVGGCVRDSLLNKKPNDWDITTNALPQKMEEIFDDKGYKTVETGIKHGTITVIIDSESFEVTTYRIDGNYLDNRRPENVTFTLSLEEDLKRRDFTINAMAYNPKIGLIDNHHGIEDLEAKIIRCVGAANKRFHEDALRMMRAVRFACQLNFNIDNDILTNLIKNNNLLKNISVERIRDELKKILISSYPAYGIRLLMDYKLMEHIIPELYKCKNFNQHNKHHDKDVYEHTLCVLQNTPSKFDIRLAALLHDIAKPKTFTYGNDGQGHFYLHNVAGANMSRNILKRLKFDNRTIDKIYKLINEHLIMFYEMKPLAVKKFINRVGIDNLDDLFMLQIADLKGSAPEYQNCDMVLNLKEKCHKILEEKEPISIKDLAINGEDLISIGFNRGKMIGFILQELLNEILKDPELNQREKLIDIVKERYMKCKGE
jgi:tRNA nucleotidyltransferase (CCA-adding enzyme)